MDVQKEVFKEEANELLVRLEAALLELEENPDDTEQVDSAFRALHTIKGSGAMFGFDDLVEFIHDIETVFDLVRNGELKISQDLVNLTLSACDQIKAMLTADEGGTPADDKKTKKIMTSFKKLIPDRAKAKPPKLTGAGGDQPDDIAGMPVTYRIRFKPAKQIFKTGTNPIRLLNELRGLGECDISAYCDNVPRLTDYEHNACYVYWDIILTTDKGLNAVKDVFIFVEHNSDINIDVINDGLEQDDDVQGKRIGEILVDRGDVTPETLTPLLNGQKRIGEILVEKDVLSKSKLASALSEQRHVKNIQERQKKEGIVSSVRVPAERLDSLVDLVGELVTVQARLSQMAADETNAELTAIAENVENLTNGLRDNTMSIRMVQIGRTFTGFRRLVRDLSKELKKDIVLNTEGGETELDKTVIDKLNDPMVHIIRNCVDHGIEQPDAREAAGKPRRGVVNLSAEHSGAHVLIRISDDGSGLDKESIREKAIQNGVIAAEAELSEQEIFQLIFTPGFSTAAEVTDVSGRGVGLDVVKKSVEALRGLLEVKSKKGEGTTITLKLPLTLAIIEGLLVDLGGDKFVVPLSSVEECVELTKEETETMHGRNILNVRGEIVPYVRLRQSFEVEGETPELEHVVITRINEDRIGFVVDQVIGGHQTVIKPLGRAMKSSQEISGATILGDGTVALILDVDKII